MTSDVRSLPLALIIAKTHVGCIPSSVPLVQLGLVFRVRLEFRDRVRIVMSSNVGSSSSVDQDDRDAEVRARVRIRIRVKVRVRKPPLPFATWPLWMLTSQSLSLV